MKMLTNQFMGYIGIFMMGIKSNILGMWVVQEWVAVKINPAIHHFSIEIIMDIGVLPAFVWGKSKYLLVRRCSQACFQSLGCFPCVLPSSGWNR